MFFNDVSEIMEIARKVGCAIFVVPDDVEVNLPRALVLKPEDKTVITIEQVREVISCLSMKQVADQFVMIRPAEALSEEAANAMLKNLEEPGEKVHFVLITNALSTLLPTVLSRSAVYFLRTTPDIDAGIVADEKVKALAKKLMTCRSGDLPLVAEEICKKKDGVRAHALLVLETAIEMLYKSYFVTGKMVFIEKLPQFLTAYDVISRNGHIKLHLVADLI